MKLRLCFGSSEELMTFVTAKVINAPGVICNISDISFDFAQTDHCELYIRGFTAELVDICYQYLKNYRGNNAIDDDFFVLD